MAKNFMSNEDATSVLTGYANAIKSKQKKTLSSPITVKGVSCTTVESCLRALKEAVDPSQVELVVGETYTFGNNGTQDIQWVCAEKGADYIVMQSTGITAGAWPGYKMTGPSDGSESWGNANTNYTNDIDGKDIHTYDTKISTLYNSIENAEKLNTSYGKGLFLVSNSKAGTTSSGTRGSGNYWSALKTAATNYSSFGASYSCAWLGTVVDSGGAWYVGRNGSVDFYYDQTYSFVVAPAFNLDPLKVDVDNNNVITLRQ